MDDILMLFRLQVAAECASGRVSKRRKAVESLEKTAGFSLRWLCFTSKWKTSSGARPLGPAFGQRRKLAHQNSLMRSLGWIKAMLLPTVTICSDIFSDGDRTFVWKNYKKHKLSLLITSIHIKSLCGFPHMQSMLKIKSVLQVCSGIAKIQAARQANGHRTFWLKTIVAAGSCFGHGLLSLRISGNCSYFPLKIHHLSAERTTFPRNPFSVGRVAPIVASPGDKSCWVKTPKMRSD